MRVSVLGLGYIGLPTSIVLANAGHEVFGFDTNKEVIKRLNSGNIHIKENNLQEAYNQVLNKGTFQAFDTLQEAEVYIIAVPTPFKEVKNQKIANIDFIDNAVREISKIIKPNDLVILESTSPPLTTRRMTDLLVEISTLQRSDFFTAHCPERVLPGKILYELENNDRIIGAEKSESAEKAKELYKSFTKKGEIYLTDDVTAEMAKLVENSFRDVNIAFANELSIICDQLNINVNVLIDLANKHPRVNILNPGVGVGGHCISVDPWFIVEKFDDAKLIKQAREVNDFKPHWVANKIEEEINFDKDKVIGILGLSYKPNIDDVRESPSIILANDLIRKGYKVVGCEPNSRESKVYGIDNMSLNEINEYADVLIIAQKHDEFSESITSKTILFDE